MANWITDNANSITAISTLLMMLATFAIAIIAWQAKTAWKKELKEKQNAELARTLYAVLQKIENVITPDENWGDFKQTYSRLKEIEKNLEEILLEYKFQNNNHDEIIEYIGGLLKTVKQYFLPMRTKKGMRFTSIAAFFSDFEPHVSNEGEIIETEKYNILTADTAKIKQFCEQNIQKLYNVK